MLQWGFHRRHCLIELISICLWTPIFGIHSGNDWVLIRNPIFPDWGEFPSCGVQFWDLISRTSIGDLDWIYSFDEFVYRFLFWVIGFLGEANLISSDKNHGNSECLIRHAQNSRLWIWIQTIGDSIICKSFGPCWLINENVLQFLVLVIELLLNLPQLMNLEFQLSLQISCFFLENLIDFLLFVRLILRILN